MNKNGKEGARGFKRPAIALVFSLMFITGALGYYLGFVYGQSIGTGASGTTITDDDMETGWLNATEGGEIRGNWPRGYDAYMQSVITKLIMTQRFTDGAEDAVISEAEDDNTGFWQGAPGAWYNATDNTFWLTWRTRNPTETGHTLHLASSTDGLTFTEVTTGAWPIGRADLDCISMETSDIFWDPVYDVYRIAIACNDDVESKWRIVAMANVTDPTDFDPTTRYDLLLRSSTGGDWDDDGVKSPRIAQFGTSYYMLYSGFAIDQVHKLGFAYAGNWSSIAADEKGFRKWSAGANPLVELDGTQGCGTGSAVMVGTFWFDSNSVLMNMGICWVRWGAVFNNDTFIFSDEQGPSESGSWLRIVLANGFLHFYYQSKETDGSEDLVVKRVDVHEHLVARS